jgi:hypothetical protein
MAETSSQTYYAGAGYAGVNGDDPWAGQISPSGSLSVRVNRVLGGGTITPSGVATSIGVTDHQSVSGALTPTHVTTPVANKALTAGITPSRVDIITDDIEENVQITTSALLKEVSTTVIGEGPRYLDIENNEDPNWPYSVDNTVTSSGDLSAVTIFGETITGSDTPTGSLSTVKHTLWHQSIAGGFTPTGAVESEIADPNDIERVLKQAAQTVVPRVYATWADSRFMDNMVAVSSSEQYTEQTNDMDALLNWHLNDPNNSETVEDLSGNNFLGRYYGDITYKQDGGLFGSDIDKKAIEVDDASPGYGMVHSSRLVMNDNFTVEAWVAPGESSNQQILGQTTGATASTHGYSFETTSGNLFKVKVGDGTSLKTIESDSTYTLGDWYYLVMVIDDQTLRFYVNGVEQGTEQALAADVIGDNTFAIGRAGELADYYTGRIQQVAIYETPFTDKQIEIRYLSALNTSEYTHMGLFDASQLGNAYKRESYPWALVDGKNAACDPIRTNCNTYILSCEDPGILNYGWMSRQISSTAGTFSNPEKILLTFDARPATDIVIYNSESLSKTKNIDLEYANAAGNWTSLGSRTFAADEAYLTQTIAAGASTLITGISITVNSIYGCEDVARLMQVSPILRTEITDDIIDMGIDEVREDFDSSVPFGITAANSFDITLDNTDLKYSKNKTSETLSPYILPDVQLDVELGWIKPTDPTEYFKYGVFYVDEWQESTDGMSVTASCRDYSKYLQENEMEDRYWGNSTAGEAISDIARYMGVANTEINYLESYNKAINKDTPLALWPLNEGKDSGGTALRFKGTTNSYAGGKQYRFPSGDSTVEFWMQHGVGYNLDVDGISGSFARATESIAFDEALIGDFDFRFKVRILDWTPGTEQTLVSMWNATGNNRKLVIRLDSGGNILVNFSDDGINNYSSAVDIGTMGTLATRWIRVTCDINDGTGDTVLKTYVSDDSHYTHDDVTWGSSVGSVTVNSTDMYGLYTGSGDANSPHLQIGAFQNDGSGSPGKFKMMEMVALSGIGGDRIAHINFEKVPTSSSTTIYDEDNNPWTLHGNAKVESFGQTPSAEQLQAGVISYAVGGSPANEYLIFNPRNIRVYINNVAVDTGVKVNDGAWHHLAISRRQSDNQIKVYKDGVLESTKYIPQTAGYSIPNAGTMILGQDQDKEGGKFDGNQSWKGAMSNLRIWDTILDEDTIRKNMFREIPRYSENLKIHYPFVEGDTDSDEDLDYSKLNNFAYPGTLDIYDSAWIQKYPRIARDKADIYDTGLFGTVQYDDEIVPFNNSTSEESATFVTDGYMKLWQRPEFELSDAFTLEGWFYKINNSGNSMLTIFSNNEDDDDESTLGSIIVSIRDTDNAIVVESYKQESVIRGVDLMNENEWNHIVVSYGLSDFHHGESSVRIYINGVCVADVVMSQGFIANDNPWLIGRGSETNMHQYWDGGVSHVAIYNHQISSDQVLKHYQTGITEASNVFAALWSQNQTAWDAMNEIATADLGIFYFDRDDYFNYVNARDYYNPDIDKYANSQFDLEDENFIESESHVVSLLTNKVVVKISPEITGVGAVEQIWQAPDGESLTSGRLRKSLNAYDTDWLYYQTKNKALPGTTTKIRQPLWRDSGYVKIDDEIIQYSGKTGTKLKNLTRGMFGTAPASHLVGDKLNSAPRVREVREYKIEYSSAPVGSVRDPFITAVDFDETVDIEKWQPTAFKAYLLISRNATKSAYGVQYLQRVDPETDIENYFVISGVPVVPSETSNDTLEIEEVSADIEDAIRRHQLKEMEISNRYVTSGEMAQDIADFVILHYENPVPIIEVETLGIPLLELGDRTRIKTLDRAGISNRDYWIESITTKYDGGIDQNMRLREVN